MLAEHDSWTCPVSFPHDVRDLAQELRLGAPLNSAIGPVLRNRDSTETHEVGSGPHRIAHALRLPEPRYMLAGENSPPYETIRTVRTKHALSKAYGTATVTSLVEVFPAASVDSTVTV